MCVHFAWAPAGPKEGLKICGGAISNSRYFDGTGIAFNSAKIWGRGQMPPCSPGSDGSAPVLLPWWMRNGALERETSANGKPFVTFFISEIRLPPCQFQQFPERPIHKRHPKLICPAIFFFCAMKTWYYIGLLDTYIEGVCGRGLWERSLIWDLALTMSVSAIACS